MKTRLVLIAFAGVLSACSSLVSSAPARTVLNYQPVEGPLPAAQAITGASLTSPESARGIVNRFDHTITFYLPASADLTKLTPVIVTAPGIAVTATLPASPPFDLSASSATYQLSDGSSYSVQAKNTVPSAATVNQWLGNGINLGNDLDAWPGEEGSWTGKVIAQESFFDDYKRMGFDSVRVPVTWGATASSGRLSREGAKSAVDPQFMKRTETVAGWGIDAGLTVVINAHHEDWIRTLTGPSYQAQKVRFVALWTQIAEHFQNWPPQLVFEVLNEPQGKMTNADVNDLNRTILAVIRASNPTRVVILGPARYNALDALTDGVFTVPSPGTDSHIIANFHNYNPWSFAGQSTGTWGSAADVAKMNSELSSAARWAKNKGVPLYMGEYGVTFVFNHKKTDLTSRAIWYRQVHRAAKENGISMAAWDDSGDFKLYDRVNRSFDSSVVPIIVSH